MRNIAVTLLLAILCAVPSAFAQSSNLTRITEEGMASWYGGEFHGRKTANGEIFDTNLLTAAHRTLPFGTIATVTNLETGKSVQVRINDRGPFVAGRSIDLSKAAAEQIGLISSGTAKVRIDAELPPAAIQAMAKASPNPVTPQIADDSVVYVGVKPLSVDSGLSATTHTIQIASFGNQANADKLISLLIQHGMNPQAENQIDSGKTRVVLRGISEPGLTSTLAELRGLGFEQVIVRPE